MNQMGGLLSLGVFDASELAPFVVVLVPSHDSGDGAVVRFFFLGVHVAAPLFYHVSGKKVKKSRQHLRHYLVYQTMAFRAGNRRYGIFLTGTLLDDLYEDILG